MAAIIISPKALPLDIPSLTWILKEQPAIVNVLIVNVLSALKSLKLNKFLNLGSTSSSFSSHLSTTVSSLSKEFSKSFPSIKV